MVGGLIVFLRKMPAFVLSLKLSDLKKKLSINVPLIRPKRVGIVICGKKP